MSRIIEKHCSPDGLLTFIALKDDSGDIALGFDRTPWHTHADIISSQLGINEKDAIRHYVDDPINGRAIIAIARANGSIRDVWVAEEAVPDKYKPDDETIEFRYWDGTVILAE